jgi:chemotaxis protein CheD
VRQKSYRKDVSYYKCVIQAGYIVYSIEPSLLLSVCGNGVVVTLQDPVNKVGGMAHCVFPDSTKGETPTNFHSNIAIRSLYKKINQHKRLTRHVEAQLFGGANFCGIKKKRASQLIADIRKQLDMMKVKVVAEDVSGNIGRKIIFNTYSGETLVFKTKKVRHSDWTPEKPRK